MPTYHQQTLTLYPLDSLGGSLELFNGYRTLAYLRNRTLCPSCYVDVAAACPCPVLATAPLDPCCAIAPVFVPYTTPSNPANPAPWWDGVVGSPSSRALGFWIEEWTGLDGAHHSRSQTQFGRSGSSFGPLTESGRTWKMNILLFGCDDCALQELFDWLENTLLNCCDPCSTFDAGYWRCCPAVGSVLKDSWVNVSGLALLEGPTWEAEPVEDLGCFMRRVSVTIGVADPCKYRCPEDCLINERFPINARTCVQRLQDLDRFIGCDRDIACDLYAAYRLCCQVDGAPTGVTAPIIVAENTGNTTSVPFSVIGVLDPQGAGCDPCLAPQSGEIRFLGIPPGGKLVIDALRQEVTYTDATTVVGIDGMVFLDHPIGEYPTWPSFGCDGGWLAIEPSSLGLCSPTDVANLLFNVQVSSRYGCC